MPLLARLTQRCRQPEIMDEPGLERQRHHQALRGLARLNCWSRSAGILWPSLSTLARSCRRPVRLLDLATGAGDVPIRLWNRARRAGLALAIDGCDRSPQAVEYARGSAHKVGAEVGFFVCDVLSQELPAGYDVLCTSLFLHHLDDGDAVELLRRMAQAANQMLLINDLVRGTAGYLLACMGTRLLSRSAVVHVDGPRSVEAAFTIAEARGLAAQAGLAGASVSWYWPWRYLLMWRRA